jgi:hypothetical protein
MTSRYRRCFSSVNLAMLAAIRRASSRVLGRRFGLRAISVTAESTDDPDDPRRGGIRLDAD